MAFTKITNQELNSRGATTLPNQPAISATALKAEFDAPAKEVVAPKVNNLIDELEAGTAAASLGGVAPTGFTGATVQAILDALATAVKTIQAQQVGASAPSGQTGDNVQALINSLSEQITNINTSITELNGAKHTHSNKSLLDSYDQSNSDISDAVSMKHSHSNKSVLDKMSEDGSGNPTYNGNTIPTSGGTGGLQKFIERDLLPPSGSGTEGDLVIATPTGSSYDAFYRYGSSAWDKLKFGADISYGTTDPSGGESGDIYIQNDGTNITKIWQNIGGSWFFFNKSGGLELPRLRNDTGAYNVLTEDRYLSYLGSGQYSFKPEYDIDYSDPDWDYNIARTIFSPLGNRGSRFRISIRFWHGNEAIGNYHALIGAANVIYNQSSYNQLPSCGFNTDKKFYANFSTDGQSWQYTLGTSTLIVNRTWYRIDIGWDGSNIFLELYDENDDLIERKTQQASNIYVATDNYITYSIGGMGRYTGNVASYVTYDLYNLYWTVNGNIKWGLDTMNHEGSL